MKKYVLGLLTSLVLSVAFSQDNIDPQRPTLTESSTIVIKNIIQAENGFTQDVKDGPTDRSMFLRTSPNKFVELRFNISILTGTINYGGKLQLTKLDNTIGLGSALVVTHISTPEGTLADLRVAVTKTLPKNLTLTYNAGYQVTPYHIFYLGKTIGRLGIFGEYQFQNTDVRNVYVHQFHYGAMFRIAEYAQIDIHGGNFVDGGLSFYIVTNRRFLDQFKKLEYDGEK